MIGEITRYWWNLGCQENHKNYYQDRVLNPFTVLGASGDPNVPGLGFRYDADERWAL